MLTVPEATVERICRWVGRVVEGPAGAVRFEPVDTAVVARTDGGGAVAEHPVRLGPHRLFGMVTDPPEEQSQEGPTVVFLSAGALDHTGSGRLWVDLARGLAAEGIRSVRLDIDGLGESFGRPGRARQIPKPPEAIDDVVDAAMALGGGGHPGGSGRPGRSDLVLVGLSSGGYHAIEAGLRLGLAGVAAVNPGLTEWVPEMEEGTIDARRRAFRPMPPALRSLAVEHQRIARWAWRAMLQVLVRRSAADPVAACEPAGNADAARHQSSRRRAVRALSVLAGGVAAARPARPARGPDRARWRPLPLHPRRPEGRRSDLGRLAVRPGGGHRSIERPPGPLTILGPALARVPAAGAGRLVSLR